MKTLSRLALVAFVLVMATAPVLVSTPPAYADQFFTSGPFTVTITRLDGEWKHYGHAAFETLGNLAAMSFTVSQTKAMGQGGCQPWVSGCPDSSHSAWIATSKVWLDSSVAYCEYNDRYGRPACDFISPAWSAPGFGYGLNEYAPGTPVYGEWFLECSLGWDCPGGSETVTVTFTLIWYGAPPTAMVTPTPTETSQPATEAPTMTSTPTPAPPSSTPNQTLTPPPTRTPTKFSLPCDILSVAVSPAASPSLGSVTVSLINNAPNPCAPWTLPPPSRISYPRYPHGATIILSATPAPGVIFDRWYAPFDKTLDGLTPTSISFTLKRDTFLGANFTHCYTVTLLDDPQQRGGAALTPLTDRTRYCNNGAGYKEGTPVQITAAPKNGFVFAEWTDGQGRGIGYTNPLSLTVMSDVSVVPVFVKQPHVPMNVYIVAYTDTKTPDPVGKTRKLSDELMHALTLGTAYHHYSNPLADPYLGWQAVPVKGTPGEIVHAIPRKLPAYCGQDQYGNFKYACRPDQGVMDFTEIFQDIQTRFGDNICSLVKGGQVQEVWVWHEGKLRRGPEQVSIGPEYISGDSTTLYRVPDCEKQRQYAVLGLNFNRELPEAMESHTHRIEAAFHTLFPCDFAVPVGYWQDRLPPGFVIPRDIKQGPKENNCGSSQGFTARAHTSNEVAQCGLAHWSPNVTLDAESTIIIPKGKPETLEYNGYSFVNLKFATGCHDWNPKPGRPQAVAQNITCTDIRVWRCRGIPHQEDDKNNFLVWWRQNIPGDGNVITRCDDITPVGNWWRYLRGDDQNPAEAQQRKWRCNPNPPRNTSLSGQVFAGPVAGATLSLYTLEPGGVLIPITFTEEIRTAEDGSYTTSALPSELDGKTLVVQAEGGSFVDEATGQLVSFEGHSLYVAIPAVDLNRPLGGTITPFTDMAFHLAQQALNVDPGRTPEVEAAYYNLWVSVIFDLGQIEVSPIDVTAIQPANIYDGQPHDFASPATTHALALAALSQQAVDRGLSMADWMDQISADVADDGVLNGAAGESAQSLPEALDEFLLSPRNPLGLPDDAPDTLAGVVETSPVNENLRYALTSNTDEDWFHFQLEEAVKIQILLTSLPANYDLYVYNSAGELLGSSTKDDKAAEVVMFDIAFPDTYYVRVVGVEGVWDMATPYQLRFNATSLGGPE